MLYVLFSLAPEVKGVDMQPNAVFDLSMKMGWFNDPIVKQMIWDIDKTKAVKDFLLESTRLGGAIPPQWLSGGVKTLILMHMEGYRTNLTKLGNNCLPWLFKLSKEKDIYCSCSNPHIDFDETDIEVICLNNGERIYNQRRWFELYVHFTAEYKKEYQEDNLERCINDSRRGVYRYN